MNKHNDVFYKNTEKKMKVNYNKLWKMLIDQKMNKTELRKKAGISTTTLAKMGKNELVSMEIILRICNVLECEIEDVIERETP